jgi:hypothetical protein
VSNKPPCSDMLCPWLWKNWQLPNIEIHCVMPLYVKVIIGLKFKGLNEEIMFACNIQHQLLWMWLYNMLLYVCGRFYLLQCYCWRAEMVRHGRTMCTIVHHVIFSMLIANWTQL